MPYGMAKKQKKRNNEIAIFFKFQLFLKKNFKGEKRDVIAITNISYSVRGFVLNALHMLTHLILRGWRYLT